MPAFVGSALLEFAGLGLIPLFVSTLLDAHGAGLQVWERLGFATAPPVAMVGLALIAVFAFKLLFVGAVTYAQNHLIRQGVAQAMGDYLDHCLHADYAFLLQQNSADFHLRLFTDLDRAFSMVLLPVLMMARESLVLLIIAVLFATHQPLVLLPTLVALGLLSVAGLQVTRRLALRAGEREASNRRRYSQWVSDALLAGKQVHITGAQSHFVRRVEQLGQRIAIDSALAGTLAQVPRLAIEFVAVCGLVVIVVTGLALGLPSEELLPVIGLAAVALVRLVPSFNLILGSANSVSFALPGVRRFLDHYEALRSHRMQPAQRDPGAGAGTVLRAVSYRYPGASSDVLHDIDLEIRRNQFVGIVGETGAGKTTLVDLLLGLLQPTAGTIQRGCEPREIGYVPQDVVLLDDSIAANVAFGVPPERIDRERVREALQRAQLLDWVGSLPQTLESPVGERGVRISGGQRQRIAIARALYHRPRMLVFDEATAALDSATEAEIMRALLALRGQLTLVVIAHRLSTVRHADVIHVLDHGARVDSGSYTELSARSPTFQRLLQTAHV